MKAGILLRTFIFLFIIFFLASSCRKDKQIASPTTLGVYEADSSIYKELIVVISKIGDKTINYDLVFDTGSGGMVMDADSILPPAMITSSGFDFTGDSVVVNGITITNQTTSIQYGADKATESIVYGNLAYAPVTVGDQNGNIVIKRLPFFLYYKVTDGNGNVDPRHHDFDTFGVNEEYDAVFSNNVHITSPFASFSPAAGLIRGFKMTALGTSNFSNEGSYAAILTLGLTSEDLSSSGFVTSQLSYNYGDGYAPIIPANVTYNNKKFATNILFDTGTDPFSYLEDPTFAGNNIQQLPDNSSVNLATTSGFNYSYTTSATENLTLVENPGTSGGGITIFGLEFFLNNAYMLDFDDHKLGVKNN